MDENTRPIRKCGKCHGPIPDSRDKRALYCDNRCLQTAKSRKRRGRPIPDPLPPEAAAVLHNRLAGLEETLRQTSSALVRARESRDQHKAQARQLETAVAAARRRSDAVAAEQAAKTAALRTEVAQLRLQLAEALAAREERQTAKTAAATEAVLAAEAAGKYRQRLAEGNAAYANLMAKHDELRKAFERVDVQVKTAARIQQSWDRLCLRLYQSTKGRRLAEADRRTLQLWAAWRQEQQQKPTHQKKAARK